MSCAFIPGAGLRLGNRRGGLLSQRAALSRPAPSCRTRTRARSGVVRMGFSSLDAPERAAVLRERSVEDLSLVLYQAVRQVFGNLYVSEQEMEDLGVVVSKFRMGELTVRELVRGLAKSDLYRSRFFEVCGPRRFVELNCKHLLGRGVKGPEEFSEHILRVLNEGYEAEIDSYLDSEEYEEMFGEDTVPRFVFKGVYEKDDDFNRMTAIRGSWEGCSTSTRTGSTFPRKPNKIELNVGYNDKIGAFMKVARGLPPRPGPEPQKAYPSGLPLNSNAGIRKRIKVADNLYQVFEILPMQPRAEPEWKKELRTPGKKNWNGVWY